ncbi:DEAD/DEAH box helicase [Flavobacterium branchiophilum]|uniref:DEAD/DEAH box helicase n=1 Tax=Flavobacterium branchiophilum TaxID=55197 RepID=A0A2H3KEY2_9FLAO|nr:DEAD/DEAH box helicase [Flavobacterium branchiophilum]PDS26930.1 DEAD/DEAH box helicase [Flavobacterium branchiophilum]
MSNFIDLGLTIAFVETLKSLNINTPTEIQQQVIPQILQAQHDVVGIAHTGHGKTVAFGVPILQQIDVQNPHVQAVILAPTRELGQQITHQLQQFAQHHSSINILATCGGNPIKPQIAALQNNPQIVVATPGRLLDLLEQKVLNLQHVQFVVLDEADEMMAILHDSLTKIEQYLPKNKRQFLFTATYSGGLKQLVQQNFSKNTAIITSVVGTKTNTNIKHHYVIVDPIEKLAVLLHLLNSKPNQKGIIFCKTKAAVNKLAKNLAIKKFTSGAIHSSLTQPIRDKMMSQFRAGHIPILVATDLAARGIDIDDIQYIVNYHLPDTLETYIHRSGRSARNTHKGLVYNIIQEEELAQLQTIEKAIELPILKYEKPDNKSIEDNNTMIWAKQIFKTKPNHQISNELKNDIKTIFHHLTKDELIDKILANHLQQNAKK